MTTNRAVEHFRQNGWLGEWDRPIDIQDIEDIVAYVTRVIRDDIILAWQAGQISELIHVEQLLNNKINALDRTTVTGDTTEG